MDNKLSPESRLSDNDRAKLLGAAAFQLYHAQAEINLSTILRKCSHIASPRQAYFPVYRYLQQLEATGAVQIEHYDNSLWYSCKTTAGRQMLVDLIKDHAKLKPTSSDLLPDEAKNKGEVWHNNLIHIILRDAGLPVNRLDELCRAARIHYEKFYALPLLRYKRLTPDGWEDLLSHFDEYLEDTRKRVLVFKRDEEYKLIPYKHRFDSDGATQKLMQYAEIWDNPIAKTAHDGVFLTLTFDESESLGMTSLRSGKRWNAFMSWVQKKIKTRPKYIKITEYQTSGRIHFHIMFFGIGRLADKFTELTPELEGLGFGKISWVCKCTNRNGRWVFARAKPPDATTQNVRSHLKKYLEKALGQDHYKVAMYWLTNRRFYTCSQAFTESSIPRDPQGWEFCGSWIIYDIPDDMYSITVDQIRNMLHLDRFKERDQSIFYDRYVEYREGRLA